MFEFGDYLCYLFYGLRSFRCINQFMYSAPAPLSSCFCFKPVLSLSRPSILYIFLALSLKTFLDHPFQSSPTPFYGVTPVVSNRIGF